MVELINSFQSHSRLIPWDPKGPPMNNKDTPITLEIPGIWGYLPGARDKGQTSFRQGQFFIVYLHCLFLHCPTDKIQTSLYNLISPIPESLSPSTLETILQLFFGLLIY